MTTQTHEPVEYVFGGRERRKFLLGMSAAQVATMFFGALAATGVMFAGLSTIGAALAVGIVVVTAVLAFVPVGSMRLGEWLAVAVGYTGKAALGGRKFRTQRQELPQVRKDDGARPDTLRDAKLWTVDTPVGPVGVAMDGGRPVGAVQVHGRSFMLRDSAEQDSLVLAWGDFLASLAEHGSIVDRVAWVDTTGAEDSGRLASWVDAEARPANDQAMDSYVELVTGRRSTQTRETFVAFRVDPSRVPRQVKDLGGRTRGALRVAGREFDRIAARLRETGMAVTAPLPARGIARVCRVAADPLERTQIRSREALGLDPDVAEDAAWPVATDEQWMSYRTDTAYHRTFWAEELPRTRQHADFLLPLLSWTPSATACRTVSAVFAPVDPLTAIRDAERAQVSVEGEEGIRARWKMRATKRQQREAETVDRREAELADGAQEMRLSVYVTVTAPTVDALDQACAEAAIVAAQSRIRLRCLAGQQADAWTYTLPLCRGVA